MDTSSSRISYLFRKVEAAQGGELECIDDPCQLPQGPRFYVIVPHIPAFRTFSSRIEESEQLEVGLEGWTQLQGRGR